MTASRTTALISWLLVFLLEMNFCMSLSLVAPCKLASTEFTGKRLFPRMRADVRGQVVTAAEGAHAYPALERLVSGVNAQVPCQLVGAREAPVTVLRRAGVGALMHWGLTGAVGVLTRPDGFKGESLRRWVMLRRVLLPADETWVDLLLVFERPNGL